ncbi:MAG TPA: EamA family transporter [Bacteroidota bacterium]|nr:EamA family transporter [Bacteroidota bacterium]
MKRLRGYLYIAIAASLWGASATIVKHLFNEQYNPLIIVQTRVSIAFALLFVYFLVTKPSTLKFHLGDIPRFFLVGVCGVAASNYFYYFAIKESNVATAIVVQYSAPIMVALYAVVIQHEKMTRFKFVALLSSVAGIFLAVGGLNGLLVANRTGIVFALVAAVSYAIFNIAGKTLTQKYSVWTSLVYSLGAATFFWLIVQSPQMLWETGYSASDWGIFALVSTTSILVPYSFYFMGLHLLSPTRAIITSTLEPVVAIATEFIFLGGTMGLLQIMGALLVIGAIVLLETTSARGKEAPGGTV